MKESNYSCPNCGKEYYRCPSTIKQNRDRTCSRLCAAEYFRNKGVWKECPVCTKRFYQKPSVAKLGYGNFCSHECWGSTRKTPIGSLNTRWSRQQMAEWKDSKCARCGSTDNLELDHIFACSLGGKSTRENCQTLCKTCNLRKWQLEDLPTFLSQKETLNLKV